jgi:RHS repeat-associated protein
MAHRFRVGFIAVVAAWSLLLATSALATHTLVREIASPWPDNDLFGYRMLPGAGGSSVIVTAPTAPNIPAQVLSGTAYVVDLASGAILQAIDNPYPAHVDAFGFAGAVLGSTLAISASLDDSPGANDAGAVYVFDAATGTLVQTFAEPQPSVADTGFGWALTPLGSDLLVGAYRGGVAYRIDGSTGIPSVTYADPTPTSGETGYGTTIAYGDGLVFVGHPDGSPGLVYVFDALTGVLERTLEPAGPEVSGLGSALLVDGTTAIVGAPGTNSGDGAVYVYDGLTGTLEQTLTNPSTGAGDFFGASLALQGDHYVVAAPGADLISGALYLIDRASGVVDETIPSPVSGGGAFGVALVTYPGTIVASGFASDPTVGTVYVFTECGDGTQTVGEQCDDENTTSGDGCSATCETEGGSTTTTTPTTTTTSTSLPPDPSTVATAIDPSVATDLAAATEFLYTGANPIQTGVAPGTIDPRRAAVVRGRVLDLNGDPLPAVRLSIHDHEEFGQTFSRADGWFDMAVNGGGSLTVVYERAEHLTAHRAVDVPWRDYALVPDVVLLERDPVATAIDLTDPDIQQAEGSLITDLDGTRQSTLFFLPGTEAELVFANGTTEPVTELHVRSTEYTVGPLGPLAMPAALPPTSAYTYAVDLEADEVGETPGAVGVHFSQPVIHYVENFLDFPVGEPVPTGFYDQQRGVWVPSDDGRVIEIVDIVDDLALLDLDGDGVAEGTGPLEALGISPAEQEALAARYVIGESLWRTPIPHFSPWDHNWPFGPGEGAGPPEGPEPEPEGSAMEDGCSEGGSIIECQNQTLGEAMPVTGSPFTLRYVSDRAAGASSRRQLRIAATGGTLPPGLSRIDLTVKVAGREFHQELDLVEDQVVSFEGWDGRDAYGRDLLGGRTAQITLSYSYPGVYQSAAANNAVRRRFAALSGVRIEGNLTRQEVTLSQTWKVALASGWTAPLLGGWGIDVHHAYDPTERALYLGDGRRRSVAVIDTSGGDAMAGYDGDGQQAVFALFNEPKGIAVAPDGVTYVSDDFNHRIRRIGVDGIVTTIAGDGTCGFDAVEGGPASEAILCNPAGLAVGPDGSLYVSDTGNGRIRRIWPDGTITTAAGDGNFDSYGDGGPATDAAIMFVYGLAVGGDGTLYLADYNDARIRRVGTDGIISTLTGDGEPDFDGAGDGGPAHLARIAFPWGVAAGPDGSVYIVDELYDGIRRIGPDGVITTVAGDPFNFDDYPGDGGSALTTPMTSMLAVHVDRTGTLYLSQDSLGERAIRRVSTQGVVTTLAGQGASSPNGDRGPAPAADVGTVWGIATAPDGDVRFVGENRVRRVGTSYPAFDPDSYVIASDDGREYYRFNRAGKHLDTRDARTNGIRYAFGYDTEGRLTSITDADGNVTTIARAGNGDALSIEAPGGHETTFTVDPNGYLATIANPALETTQCAYTPEGLLTAYTTPEEHTSTFDYDAAGRLIRDDDPAGGYTTLEREPTAAGYLVTKTTREGRVTTYRVETDTARTETRTNTFPTGLVATVPIASDRGRTVTLPNGMTTTRTETGDRRWAMQAPVPATTTTETPGGLTRIVTEEQDVVLDDPLDPLSLLTATTTREVNGLPFEQVYDATTRTLTETTPMGRVRTTVFDPAGRIASTQVGDLAPVAFVRDGTGLLTEITEGTGPGARTTTLDYDSARRLETITDPALRSVHFTYDDADRVLTQTFPDDNVVSFEYDDNGNVTVVTPPGRPDHQFGYTPIDLEQAYTPPAIGGPVATSYTYNFDRQLTEITRPDTETVAFEYEPTGGRLESRTTSADSVTFGYHPVAGNLVSLTSTSGEDLSYDYDGALVTSATWSGPVAGSVGYEYDDFFRISATEVNGGQSAARGYDLDGLLTQTGALALTRYDSHGLVWTTTLGVVSDERTYNAFGEPDTYTATVNGNPVLTIGYERDALGRIETKTESVDGGPEHTITYGYDDRGRLETVTPDVGATVTYEYDANGNRLVRDVTAGSDEEGVYDDQDRLTSYDGAVYTYTANGDLATKTEGSSVTTYTYDALGNLRAVLLPNGTLIEYVIDPENRRVGKMVSGDLTQGFLYEDQLRIAAELDDQGNVVSRFVYGTRVNVPEYMIKDGSTYRILTDHLGSPRLVVDTGDGTVAQRIAYDEFGRVAVDTSPGFQPFGFAGGLYDRDTELVRFGGRDYQSQTGTWTTKDHVMSEGAGWNVYVYSHSDPLNLVDVEGFEPSAAECVISCAATQLGFGTAVGGAAVVSGLPIVPTPGKFSGATAGTSIASLLLSRALPQRLPFGVPAPTLKNPLARSAVLGRVLGRWVPIVGTAVLANDAIQIGICVANGGPELDGG